MIRPLLVRTVKFATAHAWLVIGISLLLTVAAGIYAARNFAINTDISRLLESDAPWAKHDQAISDAFPQRDKMILAVVQAPAKELADAAANELADALRKQPKRFRAVGQPVRARSSNATACCSPIPRASTTWPRNSRRPGRCSTTSRTIPRCAACRTC
jgi:predicted RND superfamily exporter protein